MTGSGGHTRAMSARRESLIAPPSASTRGAAAGAIKSAIWLAGKELITRRKRFLGNAALVAAAVGLLGSIELLSQARQTAVGSEIASIGPSLHVVPAGVSSLELARFELGESVLPAETAARLRRRLSGAAYQVEERLLLKERVNGTMAPIIGTAPERLHSFLPGARFDAGGVLLGMELAAVLGTKTGDQVELLGRRWRIESVLPALGSSEDVAVLMPLATLQSIRGGAPGVNEIRISADSQDRAAELTAWLRRLHPGMTVLTGGHRHGAAERETAVTLHRHRQVILVVVALVVGVGLAIAAYLNALERRVEMAMLSAMGGSGTAILITLAFPSVIIAGAGALAGYIAALAVCVLQEPSAGDALGGSWRLLAVSLAGAMSLALMATLPVAIRLSVQNHVRAFQE